MTAPVVAMRVAVPAAHATAAAEPRDDVSAPDHFGRQLHAARQRGDETSTRQTSKDVAHHKQAPNAHKPEKLSAEASPVNKSPDASRPSPIGSSVTTELVDTAASDDKAPVDDGQPGDEAASALVGAMLGLLGPAVAGVLRPAGAGTPATGDALDADKGAIAATDADANAINLLQPDDTGIATALPVSALPATAAMLAATHSALRSTEASDKDSLQDLVLAALPPTPPAATAPPTHTLQVLSPPGSHAFNQELGQQVAWLGSQNIKQARIRLHPEELGSLDVSVSVTHGRVDVVFNAQHPAAVTAVQQSLPQLDHMLSHHGLSLGHAEVGQQGRGDSHGRSGDTGKGGLEEIGDLHGSNLPVTVSKVGLLDAFA
jgi:flagellar hook-length control protein FliK